MEQRSLLGGYFWPGILHRIREDRPAAVITEASPRNPTTWRLRRVVRAGGGRAIVWTKGHWGASLRNSNLLDYLRGRSLRHFDAVVAYGRSSLQELMRLGVPDGHIFVAQNTVDTDKIFSQTEALRQAGERLRAEHGLQDRRILLYPGTMFHKKRQLDMVEAWPLVRDDFPDLVLVFVGGGENLEAVRARSEATDPERIRVVGRVPEGVDYEWIAACDVAVQCGGLGLAINQCLAMGKPTVVADEPGVDGELVVHEGTGWRYPLGDVHALAQTITRVLSSPEESARVAAAGQQAIRNWATIDKMVDGFVGAMAFCGLIDQGKVT